MNLSLSGLYVTPEELQGMLAPGVSVSDIISTFELPKADTFTSAASGLLPSNLTTYNNDGVISTLPKTTLDETISANIISMTDMIKNSIKESVQNAISTQGQLDNSPVSNEDEKIINEVQVNNEDILTSSQEYKINLTAYTKDSFTSSKLSKAIDAVVQDNVDSFTNKQVRDLNDSEDYFNSVVDQIYGEAVTSLKDAVIEELVSATSTSDSITSAVDSSLINFSSSTYSISAYVRVYYAKGDGADPATFSGLSVSNTKLMNGRTAAVDNSNILLNSKLVMPDGKEFIGLDSYSNAPVRPLVYLYFDTKSEADSYLNSIGATLTNKINIIVTPPDKPESLTTYDSSYGSNITIRGINKDLV